MSDFSVSYDALGAHVGWSLDGVTPRMIDWFWSNMEKCFILWHPSQHEPLEWTVPLAAGNPLGAVHNAPQTWNDGRRRNLYIRFEKLIDVPPSAMDVIVYNHVIVTAGLGFDMEAVSEADPMGYRIHQWQASDVGVVGRSSAIGTRRKETLQDQEIWAAHCSEEISNWAVFLPRLYDLYRVVQDPRRNPFTDLSVEGTGRSARYRYIV